MKKLISIALTAIILLGILPLNAAADSNITVIDFESDALPDNFAKREGTATVAVGMSADGTGNACLLGSGSIWYISDGKPWVKVDNIYLNADVRSEQGTRFVCFSTQRYSGNLEFITMDNGDIIVGGVKVGSYIPGTWYELTAAVDRSVNTIDVWFDGIKLAEDIPINFGHEDVTNSFIAFKTTGGSAYIDDITISDEVSEPMETELFEIVSSTPENGCENVDAGTGAEFSITFSCPLLEDTISESLSISGGAKISDVSYDEATNTVTFRVSELAYASAYTIAFSDSLTGANGEKLNKFPDTNIIKFSTGHITCHNTFDTELSTDPADSGNRVKKILSGKTGASRMNTIPADMTVAGERVYSSIDFYVPETAQYSSFSIFPMASNSKNNGWAAVNINNNGTVSIAETGGDLSVDSLGRNIVLKKGMWHKIEYIVINARVSVYINGFEVVSSRPSNLIDVACLVVNLVSSEDCEVYLDNFIVSSNPAHEPDTGFEAVSSYIDADGYVHIEFSKRPDESVLDKSNVTVTDSEMNVCENFGLSLSKDGKALLIDTNNLVPSKEHSVLMKNPLSEYGIELGDDYSFNFKTNEAVVIGDIVYTLGNEEISTLKAGEITAGLSVLNPTSQPAELTYVMALCRQGDNCYSVVSYETQYIESILPGEEIQLAETLTVDSADNYFIKVFVWGNIDKLNPFVIAKAFK